MTNRALVGLALAAVAYAGVPAGAQEGGAQNAALAAQKKFLEAYKTCNVAEMNTLVTDDMQFIHTGGNTQDKAQFVAGVGSCSLTDLTLDITKVRMYGDTAIISGKFNYATKATKGTLIISEVYVKKDGHWLFASHQSTEPAAPRPPAAAPAASGR